MNTTPATLPVRRLTFGLLTKALVHSPKAANREGADVNRLAHKRFTLRGSCPEQPPTLDCQGAWTKPELPRECLCPSPVYPMLVAFRFPTSVPRALGCPIPPPAKAGGLLVRLT